MCDLQNEDLLTPELKGAVKQLIVHCF